MEEYELHREVTYEDVRPWILPVAARKLSADGITEEEKMASDSKGLGTYQLKVNKGV